ncbi:hypothetical protein CPB85DRAFT_1178162, partial [Mucidula mucida]
HRQPKQQAPDQDGVKETLELVEGILRPWRKTEHGYCDPKLGIVLWTRLELIAQHLRVFKATGYLNWVGCSEQVAVAAGRGKALARRLQEWLIDLAQDKTAIPTANYGPKNQSILADEHIANDIHLHLQTKGKYVSAGHVV